MSCALNGTAIVDALLASGTPTITVGRYNGPGAEGIRGVLEDRLADLQTDVLEHLYRRGRQPTPARGSSSMP